MLIPIDEARRLIDSSKIVEAKSVETEPFNGVGMILAQDVYAMKDLPERDVSAMDGFAFRYSDISTSRRLKIVSKLYPNSAQVPKLSAGEACYVTTGAPLPEGADVVARVESCRVEGEFVTVGGDLKPWKDVRKRGEDVRTGDLLLAKGTILTPYHLSLLEQQRIRRVKVFQVGFCIFANGDEIVPWGEEREGVPDSITPVFVHLLKRFGTVHYAGVASDNLESVERHLTECVRSHDFVISVGGSSMGDKDYVKKAVASMGNLIFEGVSTNVIKRAGFGVIEGKPVLILPGQIVSAVTSFHEHGLHVLTKMTGVELREFHEVELGCDLFVDHRMDSIYLVKEVSGKAFPLRWGVGLYSELGRASGFTLLKKGTLYREGERIIVQRFL